MIDALALSGAAIKFNTLAEKYLEQWNGRDRSYPVYSKLLAQIKKVDSQLCKIILGYEGYLRV